MTTAEGPPTHPQSFGQELRRLRENAGLSLRDISTETKVSMRILQAMEDGAFRHLPDKVFSKNFVRQYARTIGFDEEKLAGWFEGAWERFLSDSGSHPVQLALPPAPRPSFRWGVWIPLILSALLLVAVTVTIWAIRGRRDVAVRKLPAPTLVTSQAQYSDKSAMSVAMASPTPEISQVPLARLVKFTINVLAGRECWIRYRDANGKATQRFLRGGESLQVEVPGPVLLTLGNAGAASITLNDQTFANLGHPGQVVHVEVDLQKVKLLRRGTRDG